MISNPISILDQRQQFSRTEQFGGYKSEWMLWLSGVDVSYRLVVLIHDSAGEFAAFAALASYTELIANISHATGTTTT